MTSLRSLIIGQWSLIIGQALPSTAAYTKATKQHAPSVPMAHAVTCSHATMIGSMPSNLCAVLHMCSLPHQIGLIDLWVRLRCLPGVHSTEPPMQGIE